MSTENALVKPADLANLMRDKIRAELVKLIPDEAWDGLVSNEWDRFFGKKSSSSYGATSMTEFERMIQNILREEAQKNVMPIIEQKLREICWNDTGSETLTKLVKESAPAVMGVFTQEIVRQVAQAVQNNLGRQY